MKPAIFDADLVLPLRADLGEGPVWDARTQRLMFVDIHAGRIHEYDPVTQALGTIEAGSMVGCVVPRATGGVVAALTEGLWAIDAKTGAKSLLVVPPGHDPTRCRFNDGKCDPQGRLWAGTMGLQTEPKFAALYCFPSANEVRREVADVTVSNGLAWSLDGRTLYYIDSPTRRVDAFDFEPVAGRISNRRPALTLPDGTGVPDGCTLDAEGMLWVAHWGGGCVTRWNPKTAQPLATIRVPAPHTTSCAFGGVNYDTLYITTARRGLTPAQLTQFPESGGIFACRPGVGGLPAQAFAG
jgi:sugar lactone lactonase YvrE